MSRKLLAGTLVLGAGVLAVVFGWPSPPGVYARSVSDFVAHPIYDRAVRLQGTLVPGSLCMRHEPCEFRFRLTERSPPLDSGPSARPAELVVSYRSCVISADFRERPGFDLPVVVEGQLCAHCHRFEASAVIAKGGWKYERARKQLEQAGSGEQPVAAPPASNACAEL